MNLSLYYCKTLVSSSFILFVHKRFFNRFDSRQWDGLLADLNQYWELFTENWAQHKILEDYISWVDHILNQHRMCFSMVYFNFFRIFKWADIFNYKCCNLTFAYQVVYAFCFASVDDEPKRRANKKLTQSRKSQ